MYSARSQQALTGAGAQSVDIFAQQVFGYLPRADQRRWAATYLKGLLLTNGKKSMRRVAESVSGSPTVWYSLQQFMNSSPWEWEQARDALTQWIEARSSVRAWTLTPVILPKRGDQSVGVHQRFDSSCGRTINCQLAVGLFLSCPGPIFLSTGDWSFRGRGLTSLGCVSVPAYPRPRVSVRSGGTWWTCWPTMSTAPPRRTCRSWLIWATQPTSWS